MLTAIFTFVYNMVCAYIFDLYLGARRTPRGWRQLIAISLVSAIVAFYLPRTVLGVLALGSLLIVLAMKRPHAAEATRMGGKLSGIYHIDPDDRDINIQILMDFARKVQDATSEDAEAASPQQNDVQSGLSESLTGEFTVIRGDSDASSTDKHNISQHEVDEQTTPESRQT